MSPLENYWTSSTEHSWTSASISHVNIGWYSIFLFFSLLTFFVFGSDKIFNNPISLRCAHRFCEICVVKSEKPGATSCPKCQKSSLSERLPQYQLKMYCSKLEPFLRDHQNTYPQNDTSSQFMKFIKADTTLSKLNEQFFEGLLVLICQRVTLKCLPL